MLFSRYRGAKQGKKSLGITKILARSIEIIVKGLNDARLGSKCLH